MSLVEIGSGLPRAAGAMPVSTQQRIALGLLARGPLFLYPGKGWQSRAFPGESAHDGSIRALERRGHAHVEMLPMGDLAIEVARLTDAGRSLYCAIHGRFVSHLEAPRLPPSAERILAEMQTALGVIEIESERLMAEGEAVLADIAEARAATARAETRATEILTRLRRLEPLRALIAARRESVAELLAERGRSHG